MQVVAYLAESHRAEGNDDRARESRQDAGRLSAEKGIPTTAIGLPTEDDGQG